MKSYKLIFSLVAISLISCKKDFLDEKTYGFFSSDAIYSTDAGTKSVVTGAWGIISSEAAYGASYPLVIELTSGGWYNISKAYNDMNALTYTASSIYLNSNSPYFGFYRSIVAVNDIINTLPSKSITQSVKDNALGQAYLIRGMTYFNLVRMYGGVPLRLTPVSVDNTNLPRSSKEDVYQQIIADLQQAKTLLPLKAAQEKGRPAKYAASALLGKVYIAMAGNDNSSPYWANAKTELLDVINSNEYSLVPNFATLWDVSHPNTDESIIEIQYSGIGPENSMSNWYTPRGSTYTPLVTNGPFGRHRPNKESYSFHMAKYPGDPRLDATYIHDTYTKNTGAVTKIWPQNKAGEGFPYMKKYIDPAFLTRTTNCNFIYLRYADVLLSMAEVENEISGPANAYQYVNEVLSRARNSASPAATNPTDFSAMTQDVFRDRIMRERRYELMGECHLWYDTRRRGETTLFQFLTEHNNFSINGGLNLSFDFKYPLDSKFLLLPLPQIEVNTNTQIGQAGQNPGY